MDEENKPNYFAILPANVRYDKELTDKAKLLYAEITSLSNKMGYCFASNKYFADLYNCTTRSIQNAISKLQEKGYVFTEIENNYERKIYISSSVNYEKNILNRYEKNFVGGYEKNFSNNNININMIDRLFNYILNNKNEFPKEFKNVDFMEIDKLLERYEMKYNSEVIKYISEVNLEKIKYITYAICLIVKDKLQHLNYKVSRDKLIKIYDDCKKKELENKDTELEIANFMNYYYKSIVNELVKEKSSPSFLYLKMKKLKILEDLIYEISKVYCNFFYNYIN